jgi:hypothetical protein
VNLEKRFKKGSETIIEPDWRFISKSDSRKNQKCNNRI